MLGLVSRGGDSEGGGVSFFGIGFFKMLFDFEAGAEGGYSYLPNSDPIHF